MTTDFLNEPADDLPMASAAPGLAYAVDRPLDDATAAEAVAPRMKALRRLGVAAIVLMLGGGAAILAAAFHENAFRHEPTGQLIAVGLSVCVLLMPPVALLVGPNHRAKLLLLLALLVPATFITAGAVDSLRYSRLSLTSVFTNFVVPAGIFATVLSGLVLTFAAGVTRVKLIDAMPGLITACSTAGGAILAAMAGLGTVALAFQLPFFERMWTYTYANPPQDQIITIYAVLAGLTLLTIAGALSFYSGLRWPIRRRLTRWATFLERVGFLIPAVAGLGLVAGAVIDVRTHIEWTEAVTVPAAFIGVAGWSSLVTVCAVEWMTWRYRRFWKLN